MNPSTNIGDLIFCPPAIRGGSPALPKQKSLVRRLVGWYKLGLSPEEITDQIEHLPLAQVYAALTYYHATRDEIETDLAAEGSRGRSDRATAGSNYTSHVTRISLYLAEDSMNRALVHTLHACGVDVSTVLDVGMIERSDADHLDYATAQERVLYTFNVADFYHLHQQESRL